MIAIILLLMAMTVPALLQAKGQSKKTACIAQMRQIGLAYLQYREDFGEFPRSHSLSALMRSKHLNDPRLMRCPDDPFDGIWRLHYMCLHNEDLAKESYYLPFRQREGMWDALVRSDPNPGIAVCRVHGAKSEWHSLVRSDVCHQIGFAYDGPILRLRMDGSIKSVPYTLKPQNDPSAFREFNIWKLFSDEPVQ